MLGALTGCLSRIFTHALNITLLAELDARILHLHLVSCSVFTPSFGCVCSDKFSNQIRDSFSTSACWEDPGNLAFFLFTSVVTFLQAVLKNPNVLN